MTSSHFTAWLPQTLVSRPLCCFVVCECRSSDASEVKEQITAGRRFAGHEGSEIESRKGTSSAVGTDDVSDSSLSQLIAMHEDALDTDDETVDPSFDLNSSVRSDSDHLVHKKAIKSHRRISEVQELCSRFCVLYSTTILSVTVVPLLKDPPHQRPGTDALYIEIYLSCATPLTRPATGLVHTVTEN